jgi:hypothetical protein
MKISHSSPLLFDGLPAIQVLDLAFKALGHPKLAMIGDRVRQTFANETLWQDIA